MLQIVRETFSSILSRQTIAIWLICNFCAVTTGPFGTFNTMSFELRLLYWPLVITVSIVLGYTAAACARMICGGPEGLKRDMIQAVIGSLLVSGSIWAFGNQVFYVFVQPISYGLLLGYVALVFLAVIASRHILRLVIRKARMEAIESDVSVEADTAPVSLIAPLLVRRLNGDHSGDILRLTADNHFVEVISETGATSLRMRFRDAIAEMEGVQGGLVHRSHWVAFDAVESAEKQQGKLILRLRNGDEVPVSRSYRADLEGSKIATLINGSSEQSEASGP